MILGPLAGFCLPAAFVLTKSKFVLELKIDPRHIQKDFSGVYFLVSSGNESAPLPSSKETQLLGSERNPLACGENRHGGIFSCSLGK